MRDSLKVFAGIAFFVALISFAVWWQVYRWQDCRHVGHTFIYCLMTAGK